MTEWSDQKLWQRAIEHTRECSCSFVFQSVFLAIHYLITSLQQQELYEILILGAVREFSWWRMQSSSSACSCDGVLSNCRVVVCLYEIALHVLKYCRKQWFLQTVSAGLTTNLSSKLVTTVIFYKQWFPALPWVLSPAFARHVHDNSNLMIHLCPRCIM